MSSFRTSFIRSPHHAWAWWGLLLCATLALAINGIDAANLPLWYDEAWTLAEISGALTGDGIILPTGTSMTGAQWQQMLATPGAFSAIDDALYTHDVHPPLYFQTLWGWAQIWGMHPLALRALSLLCMAITALVLCREAWRHTGPGGALIVLALLSTSANMTYAAVNARGYALALMLVAVSMCAVIRCVEQGRTHAPAALAGIAAGLSVLTHYFAITTLLPVGLLALLLLGKRRRWATMGIMVATALPFLTLAALVWLPQHLDARPGQMEGFQHAPVEALAAFRIFVGQFSRFTMDPLWYAIPLLLAGSALMVALLGWGWRHRHIPHVVVPAVAGFGTIASIALLFWATDKTLLHWSVPRYGSFSALGIVLLIIHALGHHRCNQARIALPLCALIAAAGLWPRLDHATFDHPWADAQNAVRETERLTQDPSGTALVVVTGDDPGKIVEALLLLPPAAITAYTPTIESFTQAIAQTSPAHIHVRPLPWKTDAAHPVLPAPFQAAAKQAGYAPHPDLGLVWERAAPRPSP